VRSENISIFAFPNQRDLKRIVVNVSGKVGKAVVRNRIKRIYRELFRKNKEIFPESYDIIISAFKDVRNIPKKILLDELSNAFSKLMKEGNC